MGGYSDVCGDGLQVSMYALGWMDGRSIVYRSTRDAPGVVYTKYIAYGAEGERKGAERDVVSRSKKQQPVLRQHSSQGARERRCMRGLGTIRYYEQSAD